MAHPRFALEASMGKNAGAWDDGMMGWFGFRPGYAPSSSAELQGVPGIVK